MKRLFCALMAAVFLFSLIASPTSAEEKKKGKLESFEEEIERPEEPSRSERHHNGQRRHHRDRYYYDYDYTPTVSAGEAAAGGLMEMIYMFFIMGLATGGAQTSADMYRELKESESPALPTVRIEPGYQYLIGNIHGVSGKAEAGYLAFAADGEYLRYFEKNASDLTFVSGHFLLRTLFARIIGANIALGVKSVLGKKSHTGFDMGFPLYVYVNNHLIFDVLPYFAVIRGHNVYDIGGGLSYKYKFIGVRAGYRLIYTGGQSLHGPKVGLFFQW
jgi:hypothetical protein